MKKTFIILASLLLCISCKQPVSQTEKLNRQAFAENNIPIRLGYEGKNPYWNKSAKKFMYAPAFVFKKIEGTITYKYCLKENNIIGQAGKRTFYRNAPFTAPYPEAARDYKESAILALRHIHNMPAIQHWKTTLPLT